MIPPDYVLIGHLTYDLTANGPVLGGTAAYAGVTAQALGQRVGIVTSAADDLNPATYLPGIQVMRLPAEQTTTFENLYGREGRRQFLRGRASHLGAAAVPLEWRGASVVHLGPVAGEVDPELAAHFPGALIGLTLQGWLRTWDQAGRVKASGWPAAATTLRRAAAAVVSREDLLPDQADEWIAAWAALVPILAVTQGAEGSTVYWRGQTRRIPALRVEEVEPTGAGDVYAAGLFTRLSEGYDPWEAARFATCLAARAVTRPGLSGVPTAEEIAACRAGASL